MKYFYIVLTSFCLTFLLHYTGNSQIVVPASDDLLFKLRLNKSSEEIKETPYSNVIGDPFIYKDFHSGQIVLKSNETFSVEMRYDIYADLIHVRYKDAVFAVGHPEKLSYIIIDTLTFIYDHIKRHGEENTEGKGSYFILMRDGKCKLLVRKNLRVQDPEPPKILQDAKPAKFIYKRDSYYLKQENDSPILIHNIKDIIKVMDDKKEDVNEYISANKSSLKSIEDISGIVDYYNSLFQNVPQ